MQTATKRPSRAHKPAAAPFSAAAARLIEQIQAEAREQLLTDLSAKDAIIVLHGFDASTKTLQADADRIEISDLKGNQVEVFRRYEEPLTWRGSAHMNGYWHPARWYGTQRFVDANGLAWSRDQLVYVCDDFGNLVEIAK